MAVSKLHPLLPFLPPQTTFIPQPPHLSFPLFKPLPPPLHLSVPLPLSAVAFPKTLFFSSSTYTVQVVPADNEPEDRLVSRFRREVLRAGVLQECKRRRFFETSQEKRKRKTRDAQRRYRKRRPQPKVSKQQVKEESTKKNKYDSDDDNWEMPDVDEPNC